MPTASPYRVRERRAAVMLNEVQALSDDAAAPSSLAQRSLFFKLAPLLTVVCGLLVFLILFRGERVLPHAAVRTAAVAVPAAKTERLSPVVTQPQVETTALRLQRARRFTDLKGMVGVRLVRTNVRRQLCDVDVRVGRRGYRRLRVHAGQKTPIPGGSGKLSLEVENVSPGQITGSVRKG